MRYDVIHVVDQRNSSKQHLATSRLYRGHGGLARELGQLLHREQRRGG
jgi:hypothetical protein